MKEFFQPVHNLLAEYKGLTRKDRAIMASIILGTFTIGIGLPVVGVVSASSKPNPEESYFMRVAKQPDLNIAEMRRMHPNESIIGQVAEIGLPMRVYLIDPSYKSKMTQDVNNAKALYGTDITEDDSRVQWGRNGGFFEGSFHFDERGVYRTTVYYP